VPATQPAVRQPDPRPLTRESISPQSGRWVGELLFDGHGDPAARRELASLGPRVFGFFLEILHEPCQIWNNQICVLDALLYFKEDRSVFLPDILNFLDNYELKNMQWMALKLLIQMADRRLEPRIIPHLRDQDEQNSCLTADCLVVIGGPDSLSAIGEWLANPPEKAHGTHIAHMIQCQRELKARLDKEEAERKNAEPAKK
jgi:hypothetical protein